MRLSTLVRVSALLVAALLSGCGHSPPTRYFTLDPMAPQSAPQAAVPVPIQVDAFHIPALLDRREIVRATSANGVAVSNQNRWAASFGSIARDVLARDLSKRLPPNSVVLPNAPTPKGAAHLVVNVADFGPDAMGIVHLDGSWSLLRGHGQAPILRHDIHLASTRRAHDAQSQVATMSRLLARLADDIARHVPIWAATNES
jgi:uncharacterized lipoprotein YmbA